MDLRDLIYSDIDVDRSGDNSKLLCSYNVITFTFIIDLKIRVV